MNRIFSWLSAVLCCVFAVSCGDESLMYRGAEYNEALLKGELMLLQLGYVVESTEASGRGFDNEELFENAFVSFNDTASLNNELVRKAGSAKRNRLELTSDVKEFEIRTYPEEVAVESVQVFSSDRSVIEVLSVKDKKVTIRTHELGDADLKVVAMGKKNILQAVYPMRVAAKVTLMFSLTAFWKGFFDDGAYVRYKVKNIPSGMKELVTEIIDSVSVIGYCEFYDFTRSRSPFVQRDTIHFDRQDRVHRFRRNRHIVVREVSDAINEMEGRVTKGNRKVIDQDGNVTYPEQEYHWIVEGVIVDFLPVCDNPYVDFDVEVRCYYSVNTADEGAGEDEGGGGGDIDDGGDEGDFHELDKTTKDYFQVHFNDFLTDSQMDSLTNDLNNQLGAVGYNAELSDEDKDSALEEINKHKNSGE